MSKLTFEEEVPQVNDQTKNQENRIADLESLLELIENSEAQLKKEKNKSVALWVLLVISWMIFFNVIVMFSLKDSSGIIGIVFLQVCAGIFISIHFEITPVTNIIDRLEGLFKKKSLED